MDIAYTLKEQSVKLAALRDRKEEIETEKSNIEKQIQTVSQEMMVTMRNLGCQKFTTDRTFYIESVSRPSIKDAEKAYEFLREVGCGDIIKQTVHAQTLKAVFKELMESGKIDTFSCEDKGITVFVDEQVRVRRAA